MPSPDQSQDTEILQDISDLPADLRRHTAACVEHGSLPALRLVSRGWSEAANLAVRQLTKKHQHLWPAQLRLIGQRWPNLEQLDLQSQSAVWSPDQKCRNLMASLMPLTKLQHLGLNMAALLLLEGQELVLRQTRLLSLSTYSLSGGATDGLLQVVSRLRHLTRLEFDLQAEHQLLAGVQPPIQLKPATDSGVRCLSSLQTLQDLTLIVDKYYSGVTGQALSSIGTLHQLTRLCLQGWPVVNTDLSHLTHLQLLSLELSSCPGLTPGCLMHEITLFTSLHSLSMTCMDNEGVWVTGEELDAFEELATKVMPNLTSLNF